MHEIRQLCREYTTLADEDIDIIEMFSVSLKTIADMEEADMFIDCMTACGDAIVVAQAKPQNCASAYKNSVVGKLAKAENEPAVARTFMLGVSTKQMKALTQERCQVVQTVEPIKNKGYVIGVLIREKRYEKQNISPVVHLSEQSVKYMSNFISQVVYENNWLPECIDEALLIVSDEGIITFRNSLAKELYTKLGYIDDILGQKYDNFRLINQQPSDNNENVYTSVEIMVSSMYLTIKRIPINEKGISFAVVILDTTFLHEQEKQLILKSVAIKEIHHRVKNNLQMIASLLRLQTRRTDQELTKQVLRESMNRVLSIATTHELLAKSGVDEVMLGEVIINIKNNAIRYFAPQSLSLELTVDGDDFKVDSDIATSVALIINELLQNSLKYAFNGRNSGSIRIKVSKGELYSQISIVDNGLGFNIENYTQNEHLGLNIVQTLVRDKLNGQLKIISNENGTNVTFDFKNKISDLSDVP